MVIVLLIVNLFSCLYLFHSLCCIFGQKTKIRMSQLWLWRRIEMISCIDEVANEEVLMNVNRSNENTDGSVMF